MMTLRPLADSDAGQYEALDELLRAEGFKATGPRNAMPGTVFLVAEADGVLVGRGRVIITSTPHPEYGHVGLAVHPGHRRHGYATAILRACVAVLASAGIRDVLVTCREDNTASAALIERCGGVLHDTIAGRRRRMRRYVIKATDSQP